jgi:hypothetical protein
VLGKGALGLIGLPLAGVGGSLKCHVCGGNCPTVSQAKHKAGL